MRVLAIAVLLGLVTSAAAATSHPRLRLVSVDPVKVAGARFRPAERVRITLTRGTTRLVRRTTASRTGSFLVTLGRLAHFDPCNDFFLVVAVGGSGDRAMLKYIGRECPPAP